MANESDKKATPNPSLPIKNADSTPLKEWVSTNTALLIVHGIGNQDPMETIDGFGRGLLSQFGDTITVSHRVAPKPTDTGSVWFDNYLRVTKEGSPHHLDIYEYYWANYTRDLATYVDLSQWLNNVCAGAKAFYKENAEMGKLYSDHSPFFDKDGNLIGWRYDLSVQVLPKLVMILGFAWAGFLKLLARVPVVGRFAGNWLKTAYADKFHQVINIVSEVTIYNTNDEKSKFYPVRSRILDGAVKSLKYLIDHEVDEKLAYPRILVAGHSLGSQVSFDAINRINLLINKGQMDNYDEKGTYLKETNADCNITSRLSGLITFGSPLDKIAFFLRMNVPKVEYLRVQMVDDYHGFKQRDWSPNFSPPIKIEPAFVRLLDEMKWRNYYDDHDAVSGGLDFYDKVTNINCKFPAKGWFAFTHSDYWQCAAFHQDIVREFFG